MNRIIIAFPLLFCLLFWSCDPKPVGGEIKNSFWNLASIKQGNKVTTLQNSTSNISAVFSNDKISGISTCNRYQGGFTADGTSISIADISATERMCDDINLENTYLGLLGKANSYSVLENELVLFFEKGQLGFSAMSETDIADIKFAEGVGKLVNMFQPLNNMEPPHFFPIVRVDRPGNYPFTGEMIDPSLYQHFDEETAEIWNNTGGDVMAVGKFGDFFVCRVPGRYVSSDIAIFRITRGVMERSETIAWAWCNEGWCNQQDAWLQDLNNDGMVDIVQHYTLTDDKGKVQDERMNVLLQLENSTFEQTRTIQVNSQDYKMANI